MRFVAHQCWFPKDHELPRDYEDAAACSIRESRAVIADGVSSAIFSRTWSRLLTRTAALDPPDVTDSDSLSNWLNPLKQNWREEINFGEVSRDWIRGPKLTSVGAQSTLLIVELLPLEDTTEEESADAKYRLIAHSIGDCCLFLVRDGQLVQSFPLQDSAAFAAAPHILSSITKNEDCVGEFQHLDSFCNNDDLVVLCTDAIGLWAMQEYEAGHQVDWMRYWENDLAWQTDILELRSRGPKDPRTRMRVDDCTLILLRVTADHEDREILSIEPDPSDEPFVLLVPKADQAAPTGETPEGFSPESCENSSVNQPDADADEITVTENTAPHQETLPASSELRTADSDDHTEQGDEGITNGPTDNVAAPPPQLSSCEERADGERTDPEASDAAQEHLEDDSPNPGTSANAGDPSSSQQDTSKSSFWNRLFGS